MFTVVGIIISALGFISGIVSGVSLHSFLYSVLVWFVTFLYAIIYFGIGLILKNQNDISNRLNSIERANNSLIRQTEDIVFQIKNNKDSDKTSFGKENTEAQDKSVKKKTTAHKWRCQNCGRMIEEAVCPFCGGK